MFGFSFLNAGILIAGMAAVIPLLIHLFVKNKPQKIYFSSLKFLKEALEERRKKMTINQLLLLILRILIILFTIMAIARPIVKLPFSIKPNYHPPTAIAYILDTSPSMDYVVNQKTLIQQGIEIIKNIQKQVTSKDVSILLTSDYIHNSSRARLTHGKINEKELSNITFTWTPLPLESVISQAEAELNKSQYLYKEIFIISDMQETNLPEKTNIPISFIPVFQDTMRINLACESVYLKKEFQDGSLRRTLDFEIVNYSPIIQRDQIVRLIINGNTVAEKMINLNPFERKTDTFLISNEIPEWNHGWVEIRNEQFLPDNRFYFTFYSDPHPKIGIITDELRLPRQIEVLSDIFIGENGVLEYLTEDNLQLADRDKYHYLIFYLKNYNLRTQAFIEELRKNNHRSLFILPNEMNQNTINYLSAQFAIQIIDNKTELEAVSDYNKLHLITGDFDFKANINMQVKPAYNIKIKGQVSQLINTTMNPLIFENNDIFINIDFSERGQSFLNYPAFPVITYRCFSWISKYENILNDYKISDNIFLNNATVTNPNNESFQTINSQLTLNIPGIWRLNENSSIKYLSVNMSDFINQSRHNPGLINANQNYKIIKENYEKEIFSQDAGNEIWKLLLKIALIFLVLEMFLIIYLQHKAKV